MGSRLAEWLLLLTSLSLVHFLFSSVVALSDISDDDFCVNISCACSNKVVECTSTVKAQRALDTIGRFRNGMLRKFSCTKCQLEGTMRLDINAVDVNISRNLIEDILAGSEHIFNLDVAHNLLSSFRFTEYFPHLRRLYIAGNRLTELSSLRLSSLGVLDVSNNQISKVDDDTFVYLTKLTVLNLNGNLLQHLRHGWFTPLRNLQLLQIARNRLMELNNLVFMPLSELRYVDLSFNRLAHVGLLSFQAISSLEQLNLSHNNLTYLPKGFCKWFHSLQLLDISGNPLTSLANFQSLPSTANFSLKARDLLYLKTIHANDTLGLEGMVSLDLAGSALESIELPSFEGLARLRNLNLSHCKLSSLPRGLFLPLVNLERISLQGNFWHCDCGLKWLLYFLLHRQQLQVELPGLTLCSSETSDGSRSRLLHEERLLDFLDRKVHCQNATIVNYTRKAHHRLGSTAVFFCQEQGVPAPTLSWHSKSLGPLNTCGASCFRETRKSGENCSGCQMARWACHRQEVGCDSDECRRFAQECLRLVELEEADGTCCSAINLKTAVETCLTGDQFAIDTGPCLREVTALSLSNSSGQNNSGAVEKLDECVTKKVNCVNECAEDRCEEQHEQQCVETAVTCVLEVLSYDTSSFNVEQRCRSRICARGRKLYISKVSRGDSGYYMCRATNVLQTQEVIIHMTLDYDFMQDVKIFSILTGLGVAILFIVATLIGVGVEKILQHFGLKCPCDADGPIRRQNIVKILEQIEGYRRQNLERLRENYNWQVARIKENCILQMDRVKDSYIAEQTGKIRNYGSSQIGAIKDNYLGQVQRVRDYGNAQMDWLRENYVFQRNRIHKFSKHQLIRLRENYKLQQKHLNKILETLPNLESCRKGFYSETDLRELNFTAMLVPPPPPPESVLDFPTFDEFSLPDVQTGFESRSGTLLSPEGSLVSMQSERRSRRAYPTIEQVIRERLLPMTEEAVLRATGPELDEKRQLMMIRGHRRSYSAPITALSPPSLPPFPGHDKVLLS
ncbi:slit homolog 3 protein-like isoform X2 [Varroa jacobsoni]|uniref:slit homolog 3 protein-like isoform X2 n=1 Tax=Varroa jacobsoni TaxID=62625 RepID=UPI000BF705A8|nr:slit homolog 3 protein-like isoform X2 [Varroa jacobsoni]